MVACLEKRTKLVQKKQPCIAIKQFNSGNAQISPKSASMFLWSAA
jgi:hypothetical protein